MSADISVAKDTHYFRLRFMQIHGQTKTIHVLSELVVCHREILWCAALL